MKKTKTDAQNKKAGNAGNNDPCYPIFYPGDVVKFKSGLASEVFGQETHVVKTKTKLDENGIPVVMFEDGSLFSVEVLELVKSHKTVKQVSDSLFNCFINEFLPDECEKCPYFEEADCMTNVVKDAVFHLKRLAGGAE